VNAYDYRASGYLQKGDYDAAIADFTTAISLSPAQSGSTSSAAKYTASKGTTTKPSPTSPKPSSTPAYGDVYLYRGNAYRDTGQFALALADYTGSIANGTKFKTEAYTTAACCAAGTASTIGDRRLRRGHQARPGYALPYFMRGMEYFLTGRYALAIADLDRGLALYPGYSRGQPYFIKAVACERTGRTHEALVAYRYICKKRRRTRNLSGKQRNGSAFSKPDSRRDDSEREQYTY
jgi:tetratricopeptide (TPR) repeat protein